MTKIAFWHVIWIKSAILFQNTYRNVVLAPFKDAQFSSKFEVKLWTKIEFAQQIPVFQHGEFYPISYPEK